MSYSSQPYEIIIVGAGAFGLSTALHLLRQGVAPSAVLLLDSQPFPSIDAASNDTSRAVRVDYGDQFYVKLAQRTIKAWRDDPVFRPHYHECGRLHAAIPGDRHGTTVRKNLRALGIETTDLQSGKERGSLSERYPGLNGRMDRWDLYFTPVGGWAHPRDALIAGMAEYQRLGGEFIGDTHHGRVVGNIMQGGRVEGVRTADSSSRRASKVVYATGAFTHPSLLPGLNTQIHPTGFAVAHWRLTPEEQETWRNHPVVDLHHHGYFFPPDDTGLMKMGTGIMGFGHGSAQTKDARGKISAGVAVPRANSSLQASRHEDVGKIPAMAEQAIRWILEQMCPSLVKKAIFDTKVCWDGMTPDGGWIIDQHPDISGLYVAAGGSGHGFKFLPIVGEWIIETLGLLHKGDVANRLDENTKEEMRRKWAWGRPTNMEVHDPSVALQGRPVVDLETAMRTRGVDRRTPGVGAKL
ncbi:hypothetical protein LTR85_010718 [Meristemomyces frigidus]|nr:hypothetical protein LTR85_010718 [Meristemomyces frigidus]